MNNGRKIVLTGSSLFLLLALLMMSGVSIETSGDIICGETCVSYVDIHHNSRMIPTIAFADIPFYFSKNVEYRIYRMDNGKWKPFNILTHDLNYGDIWHLKIVATKEPRETIKWGIKVGNTDVDPYWIGDTSTQVTVDSPANGSYHKAFTNTTGFMDLNIRANGTIDTALYQFNSNGTNITISECSNFTQCNTSFYVGTIDGFFNITVYANDSFGNCGQETIYFYVDRTTPTCIIDITPSNITETSHGTLQAIINCSDATSGVNESRFLVAHSVDWNSSGPPNRWSIRPPPNDYTTHDSVIDDSILGVDGRENKWFNYHGIFSDNWSYAAMDKNSYYVTITEHNSTLSELNLTKDIHWFFRSSVYLSRGYMDRENKSVETGKYYEIYKNHPVAFLDYNIETMRQTQNYTTIDHRMISIYGNPNKDLIEIECNSSYNISGNISPLDDENCGVKWSLDSTDLAVNETSKNSTYSWTVDVIENGMTDGIVMTNKTYQIFMTNAIRATGYYRLHYVNGTSGTNISFSESNVSWTSNDGGVTWTQAPWTPVVNKETIKYLDNITIGWYVEDNAGNNNTFLAAYGDLVGYEDNNPITKPSIYSYAQDSDPKDIDLNGSYYDTMTIAVVPATDPDGIGTVTHKLILCNTDGTENYTINASFTSPVDDIVYVYFNTSNVTDGQYKLRVNATANDNQSDTRSYLTHENFSVMNNGSINMTLSYPITKFQFLFHNTTHKNATAYGQQTGRGVLNITNLEDVASLDMWIYLNQSLGSGWGPIYASNTSSISNAIPLTTSMQRIYKDVPAENSIEVWLWCSISHPTSSSRLSIKMWGKG